MNDFDLYSQYFPVGKKVGVGIPLPNAEVFKDWAIIHEIDEDLVSLQLSRDILPADVSLNYGQILEIRGGNEGSGYCCRAIVVSEGEAKELLLRLIGEIVSDELREFYRIDAFLPIKYFISHEQHIDQLKVLWEKRRSLSQNHENTEYDSAWSVSTEISRNFVLPHERHVTPFMAGDDDSEDSWDTIIPLAANISGGGVRLTTHQEFVKGEYTLLEILVPAPRRVVEVVGRVVFANRNYAAGNDRDYFNTGVQFVFIDERDRDAVVNYISTIQLQRIRQLRERYLYRGASELDWKPAAESTSMLSPFQLAALLITAVIITGLLVSYFWYYAHEHPKGEIQRTFEDAVRQYREQQNLNR